ncbi:hypothetical protein Q5752_001228 [Cryptotrichosporon argae]
MPVTFIPLPSKFGKAKITIAARISSPRNHQADRPDPAHETMLFLHPVWADGGFFYPQFEDPILYEHYNLVALDLPGHGQTTVRGSVGTYTYDKLVDHLAAALKVLKLETVHVVGMSCGAICGFHLAAKHPDRVASLLTFGFRAGADGADMKESYGECRDLMVESLKNKDSASLDQVTTAMFEFGFGPAYARRFADFKDECMAQARSWSKGGSKEIEQRAHMIWNPPISRPTPGDEDLKAIRCPWLSVQDEDNVADVTAMMDQHNAVRAPSVPAGRCMVFAHSPLWMTLAHADRTNRLMARFIRQRNTTMLSPILGPMTAAPPSPALKTPSTAVSFDLGPPQSKHVGWADNNDNDDDGQLVQLAAW